MNYQPKSFVRIANSPYVETRLALDMVKLAARIAGPAAALALWEDIGLPPLRQHLLPAWYQAELFYP